MKIEPQRREGREGVAKLGWKIVDEALDAVFEKHGPEIDEES
jgi:predicted P-loop ATPase/GTPase